MILHEMMVIQFQKSNIYAFHLLSRFVFLIFVQAIRLIRKTLPLLKISLQVICLQLSYNFIFRNSFLQKIRTI